MTNIYRKSLIAALSVTSSIAMTSVASAAVNEITVTIQKRSESLQDVGASVTVLSAGQLEFRGVSSPQDLVGQIANLQYSMQTGAALISIRGVGLVVDTGIAEPGVATYIDSVYQPRATGSLLSTLDLESVEVLRGPQGTFYGRNATGGVINFNSRKPTKEFEAAVTLGVGNFDQLNGTAIISGPVIEDKLLVRLAVAGTERDGYLKNIVLGKDEGDLSDKGGRLSATWLPTDNITVDINGFIQKTEMAPPSVAVTSPVPADIGTLEFLSGLIGGSTNFVTTFKKFETAEEKLGEGEFERRGASAVINWDLGNINIKSTTGYINGDIDFVAPTDGFNIDFATIEWTERSEAISQEINVSGEFGRLEWLAGGYFFHEDFFLNIGFPFALFGPLNNNFSGDESTTSLAAFIDGTLSITDDLRVFGGVRVTGDKKTFEQKTTSFIGGTLLDSCDFTPFDSTMDVLNFKKKWTSVTPRGGIQYDFTDNIMGYAQYQKGFKAGGWNAASPCGDFFEPEKIESYEAGFKSAFWDGRVTVNASGFFYDYDNIQVFTSRTTTVFVINAPRAEVKGAEVEVVATPTDNMRINFSATYLDAEYKKFSDDDIVDGVNFPVDLAGNRMVRAPEYTISFGVENTWSFDVGDLMLRGEVYHTDDIFLRSFDNPGDKQKAYTTVNLFGQISNPSGKVALRGYAKNLTNKYYLNQIFGGGIASQGYRKGTPGDPRTYGFELALKY